MCCTNNKGANEVCCLLMCLKRQSQQSFNGAGGRNFHAGLALSVLSCPPRHLSHHHSITVCLHYCRGWMNHSWGLSLGSFGGPTLPCLPPSPPLSDRNVSPAAPPQARAHTQLPPHTRQENPWETVTSPYFLSLADTEAFCGWSAPPSGHH